MNSLKTHKCKDCDIQFSTKWNLMHHRQENHEVTEICAFSKRESANSCLQKQGPHASKIKLHKVMNAISLNVIFAKRNSGPEMVTNIRM